MSLVENTYASEAEATTILGAGKEPWESTSSNSRQEALEWGVVYMNDTYSIPDQGDSTENQTLKNVNALLANEHLETPLFDKPADQPTKGLKRKKSKVDVVESEKEYDAHLADTWTDKFPHITALMVNAGFTLKKSEGGISTMNLLRA